MKAKQKDAFAKEKQADSRKRYTWHLYEPFEEEFDHSHWWKGLTDSEIDPGAALYELARRHPLVGEKRLKMLHASWHGDELRSKPLVGAARRRMEREIERDLEPEPDPIYYLCRFGLKSWPKLDVNQQTNWIGGAGKMKGVDCRDDFDQAHSVTTQAEATLVLNRLYALKQKFKSVQDKVTFGVARGNMLLLPPSAKDQETAIADAAVEAHRQGYLLLAVAPDLKEQEAKIRLWEILKEHRDSRTDTVQRARLVNWLQLIERFEDDEINYGKVKAQVFVRYRRAVDGFRFTLDPLIA